MFKPIFGDFEFFRLVLRPSDPGKLKDLERLAFLANFGNFWQMSTTFGTSFLRMLEIFAKSGRKLPKDTKRCQKLPKVVKSCKKLQKVVKNCKKLRFISISAGKPNNMYEIFKIRAGGDPPVG